MALYNFVLVYDFPMVKYQILVSQMYEDRKLFLSMFSFAFLVELKCI